MALAKELAKKVAPAKKPEMGIDEVEDSAVADLLAGIEAGDAGAVKAALTDFVAACVKRGDKGEY